MIGFWIFLGLSLLLVGAIAILIDWTMHHLYDFLAVRAPVPADILVVEGWIPDQTLEPVVHDFHQGHYRQVLTTGLPIHKGSYLSDYKSFAEVTAATLKILGIPGDRITAIPCTQTEFHRTHTSALALRDWLESFNPTVTSINLYTVGCHARRSWLIYRQVLAPDIKVGIVAIPGRAYHSKQWWRSSAGFRDVTSEAIAYFYARWIDWKA